MQDVPNVTRPIIAPSAAAVTAVPRALQNLGGATQSLSQSLYQEQLKLDNLRAEDALNKAKTKAMELSIGENGYSNFKGEQVIKRPLQKEYGEKLNMVMEDIEKDLDNPNQINLFRRRNQPVRQTYQANLTRHVKSQIDEYQDKTDVATIDIETKAGAANWADPGAIAGSRERILFTVNSAADRHGLSDKPGENSAREKFINDQLTEFHAGILDAMMVNDIGLARKYYAGAKKEINGDARTVIENKLQQSSTKADAQALTDKVVAMGLSDKDALAYVRQNAKNADVRSASVDLVKERFIERDYQERQAVEQAERYVGEHKTLDGLPDEIESLLTAANKTALQNHARNLRQGIEPNQSWKQWTEFVGLMERAIAGDEAAKSKAKALDPIKDLRPHLDNAHYDKALSMVADYRLGKFSAVSDKSGKALSDKAAIDDYLNRLFNVKKTTGKGGRSKKDMKFATSFYTLAQTQFDLWYDENPGQKMPGSVRNDILIDMTQSLTIEGGGVFWGDKEYTVDDIPPKYLNVIADDLRGANIPVNGPNMIKAYLAAKEKGILD